MSGTPIGPHPQERDHGSVSSDLALVARVIPFRFLPADSITKLMKTSMRIQYSAGESIIVQNSWPDDRMFILIEGTVHIGTEKGSSHSGSSDFQRHSVIDEGHYFGEWEVIFDVPRVQTVWAVGPVVCYQVPGSLFREFLSTAPGFAQAFGVILREKQGIFQAFDRFRAELLRGIAIGHLDVSELLHHYRALEPALHRGAKNSRILDGEALEYAVRRLPDNVTRTFACLLRDELPNAYNEPDLFFPRIDTQARRRSIWEMLPGKNLILLRSGISDLVDFLTCLCLYAVEAEKMRKRVYDSSGLGKLRKALEKDHLSKPGQRKLLGDLGFDDREIEALRSIWPGDTVERLYQVVNHREMFSVDIRRQRADYINRRTELWTHQVGDGVAQFLVSPGDPLDVHIISSNTHSVTNCLNPWCQEQRDTILHWAREIKHPALEQHWAESGDLLYALLRDYFRAFPEQEHAARQEGNRAGIHTLAATPATGIQVQLIDLHQLKGRVIDPGLGLIDVPRGTVIVNIDYAFGEQAEHIIRNLILLFGPRIRSVNFLGKAGSLVGRRGDVLIPTCFIEQVTDMVQELNQPTEKTVFLEKAIGKDRIHQGPMLTVEGTLLQNRLMLNFYRRIWSVVGLEMEGVHYHRQVQESKSIGMVSREVQQRYYYYVSDLPLEHGSNLSKPLESHEGIPPLYAITREVMYQILRPS